LRRNLEFSVESVITASYVLYTSEDAYTQAGFNLFMWKVQRSVNFLKNETI
jgi:hypothetical protein